MSKVRSAFAAAGILCLIAPAAQAGVISLYTFTDDASSQISSSKTYTAKADPGGNAAGAAVVNGVTFDVGTPTGGISASSYSAPGVTYTSAGAFTITSHGGNSFDLPAGGVGTLLGDMVYTSTNLGNGNTTTLTFSGLTAGTSYSARIYYRVWDGATARPSTIAFDEDATGLLGASAGTIDEDAGNASDGIANAIVYDYTAVSNGSGGALPLIVNITATSDNNSWHLYGVTNEVVPEPASASLLGFAVVGLLARRRRR